MTVPNTIKSALQAANVTQRAVAAALQVNEPYMSRIVAGEVVPTEEQVQTMCAVLGCQPEDLYPVEVLEALRKLWSIAK